MRISDWSSDVCSSDLILLTVHQAGLITLRDLAERMRVDRSTMQEVVKRMVGRDLLSRRVPPNDRRTHELWLGPIGGQTLARHFHAMGTLQERLLTGDRKSTRLNSSH